MSAALISRAASRMAAVAFQPGSSALKSSTGSTSMMTRRSRSCGFAPPNAPRHVKSAGRPASTLSNATANAFRPGASVVELNLAGLHTAELQADHVHDAPQRRIGGQGRKHRLHAHQVLGGLVDLLGGAGRGGRSSRKTSRRRGCGSSERGRAGRRVSASSWPAACLARSGVAACMTITINSVRGNAFSNSSSRLRNGSSVEISVLTSVLMANFRAV